MSTEPTRVHCVDCHRSQKWLGEKSLAYIGWSQTETGWLCPFHSDRGTTNLMSLLSKTKSNG